MFETIQTETRLACEAFIFELPIRWAQPVTQRPICCGRRMTLTGKRRLRRGWFPAVARTYRCRCGACKTLRFNLLGELIK